MQDNQLPHPDETLLQEFGLGKVDPEQAEWVASHLAHCPICAETVHHIADDTFVGLVRQATKSGYVAPEIDANATTLFPLSGEQHAPALQSAVADRLPRELLEHPRYQILEQIGSGGMGEVFKAKHLVMNRLVALKIIKSGLVSNVAAVMRFQREVQVAAQLQHPNIVTVFDAEQAGSTHFLVMELLDGKDAAALLGDIGVASVSASCEIVRQAALALQHAHDKGLVHRDIKPSNLFVIRPTADAPGSAPLRIKVLDLGLARLSSSADEIDNLEITSTGLIAGTIDYMAPEQARDTHAVDYRADIYALGASLYRMLTGRAPYQTGASCSVTQRLLALETAPLIPVLELRPDCPIALAETIEQCLHRDPDVRPATAEHLATALAPFADEREIHGLFSANRPQQLVLGSTLADPRATTRPAFMETISPIKPPRRFSLPRLATVMLLAGILAAGAVYQVRFSGALIQIEADDPAVAAVLAADGIALVDKNSGRTWKIQVDDPAAKVPAGTYSLSGSQELKITDDSGAVIQGSQFQLKNGETQRFRIAIVRPQESAAPASSAPGSPAAAVAGRSRGLSFDLDNSRLETPIRVEEGQPITLEAFVQKQAARPRYQNLFSNFDDINGTFSGFHVGVNDSSDRWMVSVWDDGVSRQINSNVSAISDQEVHVAAAVNVGSEIRLFLDGKLSVVIPAPGEIGVTRSPLWIGNGVPRSRRYSLVGSIRQVRISSGLRYYKSDFEAPAELTADETTLALYQLDHQSAGEAVTDASGHGHHAIAHSSSWIPIEVPPDGP